MGAGIEAILRCLPHLKRIEIEGIHGFREVLRALTPPSGDDDPILPVLKVIVIDILDGFRYRSTRRNFKIDDPFTSNDTQCIQEIVTSRLHCDSDPQRRLEKIVFYTEDPLQSDHHLIQCLQPFVERGLLVEKHCVGKAYAYRVREHWHHRTQDLLDWPEAESPYD
ncbi:hypothetical protein BKA70DRAFT_1452381 [Coprinopsis sp. MPI-PUGE-AT-0042]|nr:hypothetical protein BKA70DRAFT_1452381 [Coprinopsis sp. MPI-PUGE-AT-0042]